MTKLVTIFGGSGFIGRYIARRMAKRGWRVRVAIRRPNEAIFVKTYGVVGQVEPILCNIRDDASVEEALNGADAVVNCVGILIQDKKNTFAAVQHSGAERIGRLSTKLGVKSLVHISAIGADENSSSIYSSTKAKGENAIVSNFPNAVIFRPSIVFGQEDQFFNRFAKMATMAPVLPLIGADTRFQPVFVDDVAKAAEAALVGSVPKGIYELGGPEIKNFRELMILMLKIIKRRRLIINTPRFIAKLMAFGLSTLQMLTLGLLKNSVITSDQIKNLGKDNIVSKKAKGFETLGVDPLDMGSILPEYLWRYRPSGQYDAIKDSAKNLRS
ncbi:complex I NDUFA9 subunit family protein [Rhodobacteraceae bacterium]|nr:complex I NDUFA9 subunit family protein [Paracoccaceae bacterium]